MTKIKQIDFKVKRSKVEVTASLVGCVAQFEKRRSLAGELPLSCVRPEADGWPLCG